MNPSKNTQFAQVVDVTADGNSFAFEDLRLDGHSDRDYNDVIFQLRGATGNADSLNAVLNRERDWRNSSIGQQIERYAAANKYGPLSNVGSELASLSVEYENYVRNDGTPSAFKPISTALQVQNGYVAIEAIASDTTNQLLLDMQSLGLRNAVTFAPIVSGILPIEAINKLAGLHSLTFSRPAYLPATNVGAVDSQGDRSVHADAARNRFNVDGTGTTVGVISDSYSGVPNSWTDIATGVVHNPINVLNDIATGDLPQTVNAPAAWDWNPGVDTNGHPIATDEGRAMLQLIHDVAPGANLAFHTGSVGGDAGLAQAILTLANSGANIIVDDLRSYTEPMFQDGVIAQAVNQVVNRGVAYFSSAGNYSNTGYDHNFEAITQVPAILGLPNGTVAHDFDPDPTRVNPLQNITIPVGTHFYISLQWDSPFRSASSGSQGATSDLDIYLLDNGGNQILAQRDTNNIGQDAVEVLDFVNNGTFGTQFNLVVTSSAGVTPPGVLRYQMFGGSANSQPFTTSSPTVYGHASAAGAEAVGAAYYRNTPVFGTNPATLEDFSSLGTVPILFDTAGNRLPTPEIRQKPEIVAPDGTNTTFFGGDSDGDGFPNFFGTSAAAPHAAAVAALMLQAVPNSSPFNVYKALEETALDMGTLGVDNSTGYGLIQADQAIQRLRELETPTISIRATDAQASEPNALTSKPGDPAQLVITRTGGNINRDLVVNYTFDGSAKNGIDYLQSGSGDLPPVPLNGSILIPAGASFAPIPITAVDDSLFEPDETLDITLSSNPAYNLDSTIANRKATVTIKDNDPPKGIVSLSVNYIQEIGGLEGWVGGKPDFYGEPTIGDRKFFDEDNHPSGGEFEKRYYGEVFVPSGGWQSTNDSVVADINDSVPIVFGLYNENSFLTGTTQRVDINPYPGEDKRVLGFQYNLRTGETLGDVTAGTPLPGSDGRKTLVIAMGNEGNDNSAIVSLSLTFTPTFET